MVAEIGLFALILAFMFASLLGIVPLLGICLKKPTWEQAAPHYVMAQFVFISLAYLCLTLCFVQNDFSVRYVLANSSRALPLFYKLCAVWGGHEGSMLLWVEILTLWMLAVRFFSHHLDSAFRTRVLIVLGWLSMGFLLFLLATSNPFLRQFQLLATQGRDLNPLLQDPGFLFHPPMLYMGYVGFSVAFAFAIAALWMGQVEKEWVKWTRPWTLAAWCFLTTGITLGSWWAYRELGWGGWWFWDPVENASFMPWLVGTALIHSLMVSEKRQQFMSWSLLLAITAFSLSLIGTFLVRSGVLTSVHAFAVDPERGLYILGFLTTVIGGSLVLFAWRGKGLTHVSAATLVSRETALLLGNVFLTVAMLTVLLGTVYPLLIDGLGLGKLSVGAPYFNAVFVPLMCPLFLLMGIGVHTKWGQDDALRLVKSLAIVLVASLFFPLVALLVWKKSLLIMVYLGLVFASWIILSTTTLFIRRLKENRLHQAFLGMACAHLGVAMTIIGIAVSTGYGEQTDIKLTLGETFLFSGYQIRFDQEMPLTGPNYHGTRTQFSVIKGHHNATIFPEKRIYDVGHMAMTDAAIDVTPFRDVYIALGEPVDEAAWSVRLYFKPFVRWIWCGGFMMLLGGLLALTDKRYYTTRGEKK